MKIVFITFDFGEYCTRLSRAISEDAEVLLLMPNRIAFHSLSGGNKNFVFYPLKSPRLRQPLQQIRVLYDILVQIRKFNPDLIHFQHRHLYFNLALPLLKRYPLVITIHDPRHHAGDFEARRIPQSIMDFGYHRANQIIVHAVHSKKVVVEELKIQEKIVHVIPHIVLGNDTDQADIQEDENLILFFGRIWEYKGLEYLIRAEPLISQKIPNARIVIAGKGENFDRYQRMMVNPERFLVFNEYISDEKRTELFKKSSIVVLPYNEATQSGVIPLAYTFSKPVVATCVGGLPEIVEHGKTGLLVPPRDVKALANAILELLLDNKLRRRIGENAKKLIDSECSPNNVAKMTRAVYRCAIKSFNKDGSRC